MRAEQEREMPAQPSDNHTQPFINKSAAAYERPLRKTESRLWLTPSGSVRLLQKIKSGVGNRTQDI